MLQPCEFDTFSMSLTLPVATHVIERFKTIELLDAFAPGYLIEVIIEDLNFVYEFDTTNFLAIYIDNHDLSDRYPITFTRTDFFRKQVYHLPTEHGDYVVIYNQAIANILNEEIGYEAFRSGCVVVLPPMTSKDLGPLGLGKIQYGIWVPGPSPTPSEYDIEPPENILLNVIDDDINTYWIHHMLFKDKLPDGAISRLRLGYDGVRAINYIEIDPVAKYPFEIMGITYLAENGVETDLRVAVEKFEKGIRLMFEEIHCRGFVFYFKLRSFEYAVYNVNNTPTLDYVARGYKPLTSKDISKAFDPDNRYFKYHDQVLGRNTITPDIITYHQYTMGLAGIRSGLKKYADKGVFLAPPLSVESPGLIGLETVEIGNPLTAIDNSLIQTAKLKGVFEYYIIKTDYSESGERLGQTTIPVYPMGTDYVIERLYPSKDGVLTTSFLAHAPDLAGLTEEERANYCELKLYKNGELLARGKTSDNVGPTYSGDWYISNNGTGDQSPETLIGINRLSGNVYVPVRNSTQSPKDLVPDIYEAIYRPFFRCPYPGATIKTGILYDLMKLFRYKYTYAEDNTVMISSTQNAKPIKSDLVLKVIIRNDSYDQSSGENILHNDLTPRLISYRLSVGRSNPQDRFNKL